MLPVYGITAAIWASLAVFVSSAPADAPRELVSSLLKRQVTFLRPWAHTPLPVNVHIYMNFMDIVEVEEKSGFVALYGWLTVKWIDPRLAWDPRHFANLSTLTLPAEKLWNPGVQLINSLEDGIRTIEGDHAMVTNNGRVWITTPVTLKARCSFFMYYFPYDQQSCDFRLGSWSYSGSEVNLTEPNTFRVSPEGHTHYEWLLQNVTATKVKKLFPCCSDEYQEMVYHVQLARRSQFLVYAYLEPVVLLSGMVSLVFMLPVADEHRYVLSLGLLVSMTLSMSSLDWMFAGSSGSVPLLGQYYISIHILLAMAIVVSTAVTNMADRGNRGQFPPKLLRLIFIRFLGKLLLVPKVAYAKVGQWKSGISLNGDPPSERMEHSETGSAVNEWYRIALALDRFSLLLFGFLVIGIFVTFSIGLTHAKG